MGLKKKALQAISGLTGAESWKMHEWQKKRNVSVCRNLLTWKHGQEYKADHQIGYCIRMLLAFGSRFAWWVPVETLFTDLILPQRHRGGYGAA